MLRFLDGCSHYSTGQLTRKWSVKNEQKGTVTISSATGRNGVNSIRCAVVVNPVAFANYVQKTLDAQASWVVGFAFKVSALPTAGFLTTVLSFFDNVTTQCDLRLDSAGILSVTRNGTVLTGGTALVALATGTWYYLEMMVTISNSIAANSCKVYIDGVQRINVTAAQDTQNTANATADNIRLGAVGNVITQAAANYDFCDIYILDGQTGHTTVYGDTRVVTLLPTGNGATSQWVNNAGNSTNNYSKVNAAISGDGTTGFVQSGTIGNLDTYAMADLAGGTVTVRSAQAVMTAEETDVGTRTLGACVRSGGSDHSSAGQQLTGGYAMYAYPYETDPNGSIAWTPTTINAVEVGPVLVS